MSDIQVGTEASNISAKRKKIEERVLQIMKMQDKTNENYERYKKLFSKMSDGDFSTFMKLLEEGKTTISMYFPNMHTPMKLDDILATSHEVGNRVHQRIVRKDPVTGKTYKTPNEHMILTLPVRRVRQFHKGKISVSDSDKRVDALTGQVVKPDRAAAISYVEMQLLYAKGLNNTLQEMVKVRGGDLKGYSQLKQQMEETGQAHLGALHPQSVTQSSIVASAILTSMMFEHNMIEV